MMALGYPRQLLVYAGYRQVFLAPIDVQPVYDDHDEGPLLVITDNGTALIVITGCANGPVLVGIELLDAAPDISTGWEVQEEVDLIVKASLHMSSPIWTDLFEPVLEPSRPGLHRLRVSGRGRHTHPDLSVFEPTEHYLVQAWPSETPAPRAILLDDGAGFRTE